MGIVSSCTIPPYLQGITVVSAVRTKHFIENYKGENQWPSQSGLNPSVNK